MGRLPKRKRTLTARELEWELEQVEFARAKRRDYYRRNKEKLKAARKKWEKENPDKIKQYTKTHYDNWRETIIENATKHNRKLVRDPLTGDVITYNTLVQRKMRHPVEYADVIPCECYIEVE